MNPIKLTFTPPLDEPDKHVWDTLGDAPQNVNFPTFDKDGRDNLLADIKAALKKKLKDSGGNLDLRKSGETKRDKGLLLESDFTKDHKGKEGKKNIANDQDVDHNFKPDLMQKYFDQAAQTQGKFDSKPRGIPHDYDTINGGFNGPKGSFEPNAWLPGVFVIDEIFKALLSTVDKMIKAANDEIAALKKNALPAQPSPLDALNKFIEAFSTLSNGPTGTDADKFRAFINYYPFDPNAPEMQTYIKLVYVEGFIVSAIVHVGDWAGGYHSSGSAIHS